MALPPSGDRWLPVAATRGHPLPSGRRRYEKTSTVWRQVATVWRQVATATAARSHPLPSGGRRYEKTSTVWRQVATVWRQVATGCRYPWPSAAKR